jgi:hypothetical protein
MSRRRLSRRFARRRGRLADEVSVGDMRCCTSSAFLRGQRVGSAFFAAMKSASVVDLKFALSPAAIPESECQIQNHTQNRYFAGVPLVGTFVNEPGRDIIRMSEPGRQP